MFVNKINSNYSSKPNFKGYMHEKGQVGEHIYRFNYPHDANSNVRIEFYKVKPSLSDKSGYEVVGDAIKKLDIKENGAKISFDEIAELKSDEAVAYKIFVNDSAVKETGITTDSGYTVITRNGTNPVIQGQGVLTMPDIQRPGAYYADFKSENTGAIVYDKTLQEKAEANSIFYSSKNSGNLAGLELDIELFKKLGVNTLFTTPIWNADNKTGHHYWNKNNKQISDDVGNIDNYETYIRALFKNGIQNVDDVALTSEGLEGIHVQYALKWKHYKPQDFYLFRMQGLNDGPVTLGVVPKNTDTLRFKIVNPTVIYNSEKNKIEANPNYDYHKETYFQIYDNSLVSEEQRTSDKLIVKYENINLKNELEKVNSNDTVFPYAFEINPKEYEQRLKDLIKFNDKNENPIKLDSAEGAKFIGQFSAFKIGTFGEGAVFWDSNNDIFKMNYGISGYDEKLLQAISDDSMRDFERKSRISGAYAARDLAIQAGKYRTQVVKDAQIIYAAQILKNANTYEEISSLINKELPKSAELNAEQIKNIKDGWYNLAPKGLEDYENTTIKALMKMPLDALELGDNTQGVLASPFFSNRAVDRETLGLSRFDMYKQGLGYGEPYSTIYNKVDKLFINEVKDFADEVIKVVDKNSKEKLLDAHGNYTEYGEYVIDLIGKDITKYAFLKAIAGDKLEYKVMSDDILSGKITYNYQKLREDTTLKSLGINSFGPEQEAQDLFNYIQKGFGKNLKDDDISFVADAINKRIANTSTLSFRLAEAMVDKAGLGLSMRLDAAKDFIDWDAVRNGDMTFDAAWDETIDFLKNYVQEIKKVNPNAYIVAEITDIDILMKHIFGEDFDVYNGDLTRYGSKYKNVKDAMTKFFAETGITSEAAYAYTFTDLLKIFSPEFEGGTYNKDHQMKAFMERIKELFETKDIEYIRNMWTFADNHDKPSVIHGMALDMSLFHADLEICNMQDGQMPIDLKKNRNARIEVLKEITNSDKFEDLPLEAMLNIDNRDYFRTANTRAVAMAKLMRNCINSEEISSDMKSSLKNALSDIVNGNYLKDSELNNLPSIQNDELKSFSNAFDDILKRSGLFLTAEEKDKVINAAKQEELVVSVLDSLGNEASYSQKLVAVLDKACKENLNAEQYNKFKFGTTSFIDDFSDSKIVINHPKYIETPREAAEKNGFASKDFETVISMIMKQAEFKSGREIPEFEKNDIMEKLFRASTEPAIEKALMYASFLSGLPGIPSLFIRDILGGLGFDEKAKNVYLQNRTAVKWSGLENGPLKDYRNEILEKFTEVMQIRSLEGVEPINNGTPYILSTGHDDVSAFLYQDAKGSTAISILNAFGIDPTQKLAEDNELELDSIALPAGLALPVGAIFVNAFKDDIGEYIVKLENGIYKLINKNGNKLKLNKKTAKNGVMILKRTFKGRNINPQYNLKVNTNIYSQHSQNEVGKNFSIIAK